MYLNGVEQLKGRPCCRLVMLAYLKNLPSRLINLNSAEFVSNSIEFTLSGYPFRLDIGMWTQLLSTG